MERKNIKKMMKEGQHVFGMVANMTDPAVIEIAGICGYDFVRLDCEHTPFSICEIRNCVRAADAVGIPLIVRITELDAITGLLDFGVGGFMIPHVRTAEEAERIVRDVKYYPVGLRGFSDGARAQNYGFVDMEEFIRKANDEIVLMCQIEDKYGIANMEEIIAVDGIDGICTGPNDIAQSLGIPTQTKDIRVKEVERRIISTAKKYGKQMFMSAKTPERAKELMEQGVLAISVCYDYGALKETASAKINFYKELFNKSKSEVEDDKHDS